MNLQIYREGNLLYNVSIDESTIYSGVVMGENVIKAQLRSPVKLVLLIGDHITFNGEIFTLNRQPEEQKLSSHEFAYSVEFESLEYSLYNKILTDEGSADFSYFGTPDTFLDLILGAINTIDSGWAKGTVEVMAGKTLTFDNETCRQALTKVAEAFGLEFSFDGKVIDLVKTVGIDTGLVFKYGQSNGLYTITRKAINSEKFGTRFIGYGSTKNLPATYRNDAKRLTFDIGYVDRNVATYGIIERPVIFEDVFPQRTGTISDVGTQLQFTDIGLDFDLNDVIVKGQSKVVFKSGDLNGQEFEIDSYNHATKTITINANEKENGYILPNDIVKSNVGDTYTLVGIEMPASYIEAAEAELYTRTLAYAEENKNPKYAYDLAIDEKFIRDNNLVGLIRKGDRVTVEDIDLGINVTLRIQAISYPLSNPGKITATLSDEVSYTLAEQIIKTVTGQKQEVRVINKTIEELNRDFSVKQREFQSKVFDPDGYFDGGKIKPETIETLSFAAGARSQQFTLSVIFRPNYDANPNAVLWSSGKLVHNTISDDGIRTWEVSSGNRNDLQPLDVYYIYARCPVIGASGTIVLDTAARKIDDDPDYYYFLIGQLSSVIAGVRWCSLTYGSTEINGRFLTTGRISSINGQSYIDLDTNQFNFGDSVSGIDYNVTTPNQLTVRGHIEATSGSIGGVTINADNNFNLNGSRVKINPSEGVKIFNGGYLKIPTSAPISGAMQSGDAAIWAGDLSGITNTPGSDYILPIATASVLGGVKVGSGLIINPATGVLSVTALGGVISFNTRTGAITLLSSDVTGALGYTPYNASNPNGYIAGIDNSMVVAALGYTPYSSMNPSGYISGITGSMVTSALGFTPYNATNPAGYITSAALGSYLPLTGGTLSGAITAPQFNGPLDGIAANSTQWGGYSNGFGDAVSNSAFDAFVGQYNNGVFYRFSPAAAKSALGLPASGGYDLQSVTDRGSTTTNLIELDRTGTSASSAIRLTTAGANDWFIGTNPLGTGSDYDIYNYVTNSISFRILKSNGNVGIGVPNPIYKLEVDGTISGGEMRTVTIYASNWFRSTGATGWYNETYGGGIHMTDSEWVRVYNSRKLRVENDIYSTTKVYAPTVQATSKLIIPTTAPGTLAAGEAAVWVGDLSGITA